MARTGGAFPSGVVEGFYGKPWSPSERVDMIRFLGESRFNTYFYAPKDDLRIRSTWRSAYPRSYLGRIRELAEVASESSVDLAFAISPGLDFGYSSTRDRDLLLDRLRTMAEMGCNWVGVLLDDIPTDLARAKDRREFSGVGEAHVSLLNGVLDGLRKNGSTRLAFCPTYYANEYLGKRASENEYLEEIGENLDPLIDVFWTGRYVVSPTITEEDVLEFEKVVGRKPLLWDNYPVNDYYRPGSKKDRPRLNMGPFEGRAPEIVKHLAGYLSNPMNEPEASKIPLLTLSDYLQDPYGYSPEQSFERAVERHFSAEKCRREIGIMMDCSRASPLDPREVEELRESVRALTGAESESVWEESSKDLQATLEVYLGLRGKLFTTMKNRRLLSEFKPVLDKVHRLARLGLSCLELARWIHSRPLNGKDARLLKARMLRQMGQVRANKVQALGEVAFEPLLSAEERKTSKGSVSEIGLQLGELESPVIELHNWTTRLGSSSSLGLRRRGQAT